MPYCSNYSWGQFIVDLFSISFIACLHSCSAVGLSLQCLLGIFFLLSLAWLLGLEKLFQDSSGSLRALLERSQILISSWESCHKPCGCWVIAKALIHGTHDEPLLDNIGFRFFCTVLWKENQFWAIVLASVRTHKKVSIYSLFIKPCFLAFFFPLLEFFLCSPRSPLQVSVLARIQPKSDCFCTLWLLAMESPLTMHGSHSEGKCCCGWASCPSCLLQWGKWLWWPLLLVFPCRYVVCSFGRLLIKLQSCSGPSYLLHIFKAFGS